MRRPAIPLQRPLNPLQLIRLVWHVPNFVRLYWRLFRDRRTPWYAKALLVAAVAYLLSPIDLIPDWVPPIIGELDDVAVIYLAAKGFIHLIPRYLVDEHVRRIDAGG